MGRLFALVSIAIACAGLPVAWALADDGATCRSGFDEKVIAACSRLVASGNLNSSSLVAALSNRGYAYNTKGDYDRAIRDFDQAIRMDPKNYSAYNGRGNSYYNKLDYERAMQDYDRALELSPKYGAAFANRGNVYKTRGELDRAIHEYDQAIDSIPKYAIAFALRGGVYQAKGDNDRAIADYDAAIRINPKYAVAIFSRGTAYGAKGDNDRAIADYNEAIRLDPKYSLAYDGRGNSYFSKNDHGHAIADYSEAIRLDSKFAAAYVNRGSLYFLEGNYDRAIVDFNEAIRIDPKFVNAYNGRGSSYLKKSDYDRALADLNEAIRIDPSFANAYNGRGTTYLRMGDLAHAFQDLDEATRLDPKDDRPYLHRGEAYLSKGAPLSAVAQFEAALRLDPTDADARKGLDAAHAAAAPAALAARPVESPPSAPLSLERRVALVIGNSDYRNAPALPNPGSDAQAIAAALRGLRFQTVTLEHNLTRERLIDAFRAFAAEAERADWALIYFAGHGVEVGGVNYLLPVDARLAVDRDAQFEAVPLEQALGAVEGARKLRLVLLDACRENPFKTRSTTTARAIGRGLARIEPGAGTLVVYAARDGQIAYDGSGQNSPFATALLKELKVPGVELNKLFRLVHDDVMETTDNRQEPYTYGALSGRDDFFFMPR